MVPLLRKVRSGSSRLRMLHIKVQKVISRERPSMRSSIIEKPVPGSTSGRLRRGPHISPQAGYGIASIGSEFRPSPTMNGFNYCLTEVEWYATSAHS